MDARLIDKSKLPSRYVTEGPARAPHRSYLYAMGLTKEQIHQPLIGVATCWNEAAPCNISLMRQAQAVKKGVAAAGATPREFCTITVTDGIAMGHAGMRSSLPSREVIADSVELTMRGHAYDALVGLGGLRQVPARHDDGDGAPQRAVRLIYGGSILPGSFRGRPVTVQDLFEAVGKHSVGDMSDADLDELEQVACPSPELAAPSSRPTRWRPCPRRSASRCPIRPARPRLTRSATGSARPQERSSSIS
jgi:dihydroxy-acid dehydratase